MSANSSDFPWPSYYGHYEFFEKVMAQHSKVLTCEKEDDGVYQVARTAGDPVRVFICECYSFGVAEYLEAVEKVGDLGAVLINSTWCGYSPEAKRYCRDNGVGLFKINEFMAALNRDDFWLYLTDYEVKRFRDKGWI